MSEIKTRTYGGVIYPDSENYCVDDVLLAGKNYFSEFCYILHDKDVTEDGELKKAHIHWLGRRKNATGIKYVSEIMGLKLNEIEAVKNWKGSVRYLTHIDYPDKYRYEIEDIKGNIEDIVSYFEKMSEGKAVLKMIVEREEGLTYKEILIKAVEGGYYDCFRRNVGIVDMVVKDSQNAEYRRAYESGFEKVERKFFENEVEKNS